MLSELHSLNLKLYSKQYNKKFVLHLIVVPQLGGGRQNNYSTKTRQAGRANEQSMHRYGKAKIDCLSLFMCPLLAQLKIGFFSSFSAATVYSTNKQTRQALSSL
jgi:hypothetical protein